MSSNDNFKAPPRFSVHNETPSRLKLIGIRGRELILSPLERTAPLDDSVNLYFNFQQLEQSNKIRVCPEELDTKAENIWTAAAVALFLEVSLSGIIRPLHPFLNKWYWSGIVPGTAGVALLLLVLYRVRANIPRVLGQWMSLIFVLVIGIGLPGAIIWMFGGVGTALAKDGFLFHMAPEHVSVSTQLPDNLASDHGMLYVGRLLQWIFIAVAALIPSLLYFLFDRQFLGAMRDRFEQAIFRLDPNIETLTDIRAKYGRQIEKVYGLERYRESRIRLIPGTRMPILLTTLIMVLGWLVTLEPISGTARPLNTLKTYAPRKP